MREDEGSSQTERKAEKEMRNAKRTLCNPGDVRAAGATQAQSEEQEPRG